MEIASEKGVGTLVTVTLPIEERTSAPKLQVISNEQPAPARAKAS